MGAAGVAGLATVTGVTEAAGEAATWVAAATGAVVTTVWAGAAAEAGRMKTSTTKMRASGRTMPKPTLVNAGSTMLARWVGLATNPSWMATTVPPTPTFSPSSFQPVT